MAFLMNAALDGGAALRGGVKTGTFKFSRFDDDCVARIVGGVLLSAPPVIQLDGKPVAVGIMAW